MTTQPLWQALGWNFSEVSLILLGFSSAMIIGFFGGLLRARDQVFSGRGPDWKD